MTPSPDTLRDSKYSPKGSASSLCIRTHPNKDDKVQKLFLEYIVGCVKVFYLGLDCSREEVIDRHDGGGDKAIGESLKI